jgi:hypothetical protein
VERRPSADAEAEGAGGDPDLWTVKYRDGRKYYSNR